MTRITLRLAVVVGLLAAFGNALPVKDEHLQRRLLFPSADTTDTYDYIVVGGGTSGMTLAARLSENKGVTVAVLEAGIDYRSNLVNQQLVDTPGYDVMGVGSSPADQVSVFFPLPTLQSQVTMPYELTIFVLLSMYSMTT